MARKNNFRGRGLHRLCEWSFFRPKLLSEGIPCCIYENIKTLGFERDFKFCVPLVKNCSRDNNQMRRDGDVGAVAKVTIFTCYGERISNKKKKTRDHLRRRGGRVDEGSRDCEGRFISDCRPIYSVRVATIAKH